MDKLSKEVENYVEANINVLIPEHIDEKEIEEWKKNLFQNDEVESINNTLRDKKHWTFINFYIDIYKLLFQLVKIPIFNNQIINEIIKTSENTYEIKSKIVLIDYISLTSYKIILKVSLDLCTWMSKNKPSINNLNIVYETIVQRIISPFGKEVPGGKSTIPLLKSANKLGIPYFHLGLGVYQLGWGSSARRVDRSSSDHDSASGSKLTQHKAISANILRSAGLPAPTHDLVVDINQAIYVSKKLGFPVVVKPADLDRGEGVTTDIHDESKLRIAFFHAQKLSKSRQVIVERQVLGTCHRFLVINEKLLYTFKRNPISVIGDGVRTLKEIIEDEVNNQNKKPPWSRSKIKPIDQLAIETLKKLSYTQDSVPQFGEEVPLRLIQSDEWGGTPQDVSTTVHEENKKIALQAAKLFKLDIAGVDIISDDISQPWYSNGAIINEINFSPLFGGNEMSVSYMPEFFKHFISGDGRIPVEIFDTEVGAIQYQKDQLILGKRCHLTSDTKSIDHHGNEIFLPFKNIRQRFKALIMRDDVDAVALIIDKNK